jgi:hypothetical protein
MMKSLPHALHDTAAAQAVARDGSNRAVYKYPVPVADIFTLDLPAGAQVLSVGEQFSGQVMLWALVRPAAPTTKRHFRVVGTGHPIRAEDNLQFCGTFLLENGGLVFHLFQVMP